MFGNNVAFEMAANYDSCAGNHQLARVTHSQDNLSKPLGFWSCWSLTVGIMIGSGVFLLPSVLAPYGTLSFAGWLLTGGGSVLLALVFARLATRTRQSGGVYIYTRDAFGDLPSFIVAWGYWTCYWIAIPAMAIAFVVAFSSQPAEGAAINDLRGGMVKGSNKINRAGLHERGVEGGEQAIMTVKKNPETWPVWKPEPEPEPVLIPEPVQNP